MKNSRRNYLFVCGVARSGTTALARLLNQHSEVVVGIERYKYRLMGRDMPADPGILFERERFFSYDPGDTNIRPGDRQKLYAEIQEKFDTALYVGDKVPSLYKRLPFLREAYPECRIVYIVRDPVFVAASWETRARNPDDEWRADRGHEAAVAEWNRSVAEIAHEDVVLVSYERAFVTHGIETAEGLKTRLGLNQPWNRRIFGFLDRCGRQATKERSVPVEVREYVDRHADYSALARLSSLLL